VNLKLGEALLGMAAGKALISEEKYDETAAFQPLLVVLTDTFISRERRHLRRVAKISFAATERLQCFDS